MECAGKQTFCISSVHASSSVQWSCSLCIAGQAMCYMIQYHLLSVCLWSRYHILWQIHIYINTTSLPHYSAATSTADESCVTKTPGSMPTVCYNMSLAKSLLCDQVSHVMTKIYAHNTHTGVIQLQKAASSTHSQVN